LGSNPGFEISSVSPLFQINVGPTYEPCSGGYVTKGKKMLFNQVEKLVQDCLTNKIIMMGGWEQAGRQGCIPEPW
jgi:hypothetical protein